MRQFLGTDPPAPPPCCESVGPRVATSVATECEQAYDRAVALAENGEYVESRAAYRALAIYPLPKKSRALVENDLGVLALLTHDLPAAQIHFERALVHDAACQTTQCNLEFLTRQHIDFAADAAEAANVSTPTDAPVEGVRVALISLLFNFPSTGGGTVHTAETAKFLHRAGYVVRHFYARFDAWGVGQITVPLDYPATALRFAGTDWNAHEIQRRFRDAVDSFAPDYVIITDSWSFKPLLAEAVRGYRYFLRLAAQECLCPLNNVRLLVDDQGRFSACPRNQLATADVCRQCVSRNHRQSGSLHQAERALAGYGTAAYDRKLHQAFAEAEGVLAVNPLIATMAGPYAKTVHVVPSGFDPDRFPPPCPDEPDGPSKTKITIFFAGLVNECMKGFHVLQAACARLWQTRQDFELVATADPIAQIDPMTRYVGWLSQDELPRHLRQADIIVCPTIAEEALGRTAVEAMGAGRAVIASRIGGLSFTVTDGLTGLLCEPGNADDLAAKIALLLDDPVLRRRLGEAGRKKFESEFTWDNIIQRHYQRLMPSVRGRAAVWTSAARSGRPNSACEPHFVPRLHTVVDQPGLLNAAATFFNRPSADVSRMWETYQRFAERQGYARTLGELKTLSTEEGFLLALALSLTRPPAVVELGTQHGKSTRRIVDLVDFLGLDSRVVCYDIVDELQYVTREDIDFRVEDLTGRFRTEVLDKFGSGLVFFDAHPFALLSEVVRETIGHYGNWTLAIHDCSPGLCNPHMPIGRDDPCITSSTGVWERHVLAEVFGVDDPLDPRLDSQETSTCRLQVFGTQHGLGLIVPKSPAGRSGDAAPADRGRALVGV